MKDTRARGKSTLLVIVVGAALMATMLLRQPGPTHAQYATSDPKAAPPVTDVLPAATTPAPLQREGVGPVLLLRAGTVDGTGQAVTLPLFAGRMKNGKKVWYIVTDAADRGTAEAAGLNYSSKLAYAGVGRGARVATLDKDGILVFEGGTVDFSPARKIAPGSPGPFPPKSAEPGSVGDRDYSPLVRIQNAGNQIFNIPIIAFGVEAKQISFCDGNPDYRLVHDRVLKICPEKGTVTLALTLGFSVGRPVSYVSTDSSDRAVAAMEGATYAPGLGDIPTGASDAPFSAVERIVAIANGPTGADNPQRQGLASALTDARAPLNVLGGIPTLAPDYSPLWSVHMGAWTEDAIRKGHRARVTDETQVLTLVQRGWITGPGGSRFGPAGVIVNCPVVARLL